MQRCAQCKSLYPTGVSTCPRDGAKTAIIPPEEDPLLGVLAGSYRLQKKLGEGGMGVVYAAEHTLLGKKVAVKVLQPEYASRKVLLERFFAEARAASQIGHEHIVDVQDLGTLDGGLPFFVME